MFWTRLSLSFLCSKEGGQALLGRSTEVPHCWPPGSLLPPTQLQSYWATGHQRHKKLENCRNLEIQSNKHPPSFIYNHICTIVHTNLPASVMLIALGVKPVCSQQYSFTIIQAKLLVSCSDSPEYENSVLPSAWQQYKLSL